ncbi:hypothetical protein M569_12755, partial [Genlisea aurea]
RNYKWWIQMSIYSIFVLSGQAIGTILQRLYFTNGGKSKWMATLVQVAGFPILLIPFSWLKTRPVPESDPITNGGLRRTRLLLAAVYFALGGFLAVDCMLYTIGIQYLPVTTFTLICASQLGFNAIFSYFLNGQRFTPYIVNSVFVLTVSSVLLVFQSDNKGGDSAAALGKNKYVLGFVCTLLASAGYGFMLSITQLVFRKMIGRETLGAILELTVAQNLVAAAAIVVGLFASGDWEGIPDEMRRYELGRVSYVMNLVWTSVAWQCFNLGCTGLIFKVSSLFSNVISILGLPVGPVLAVFIFNDKFTGLKGVSMALAMWGFVSYMYQYYVND